MLRVGDTAAVRVPASSANLGPGFDSFALALDLSDHLAAEILPDGLEIVVNGEGAATISRDAHHLVFRAMRRLFDEVGVNVPGVRLRCENHVPHSRGLGSSAAAIVGGLALANALLGDVKVPSERLLELACGLEGHPDNVAAALYGGFTIAWTPDASPRKPQCIRLETHPELRALVAVPGDGLSTQRARAALPEVVPHQAAAANAARAGLLVEALTRNPDLLFAATEDRIHQEYRRAAYPATYELLEKLRAAGLAAVVSGAGPSVLVLSHGGDESRVREICQGFEVRELAIDQRGVSVVTGGVVGLRRSRDRASTLLPRPRGRQR